MNRLTYVVFQFLNVLIFCNKRLSMDYLDYANIIQQAWVLAYFDQLYGNECMCVKDLFFACIYIPFSLYLAKMLQ